MAETLEENSGPISTDPLFRIVFGENWDNLPPVMRKHYAIRPFSEDRGQVEGYLDIKTSPLVRLLSKMTGMLLSQSGENVPVTVTFRSDSSGAFHFERCFHFPDTGDETFHSRMVWLKDNILVEFMRFGIGWKLAYEWDGQKVILEHRGYVWRLFGMMLPLPLSLILGKGYAEETPLTDDSFAMWTHARHPLWGKTFGYSGQFQITEVTCAPS